MIGMEESVKESVEDAFDYIHSHNDWFDPYVGENPVYTLHEGETVNHDVEPTESQKRMAWWLVSKEEKLLWEKENQLEHPEGSPLEEAADWEETKISGKLSLIEELFKVLTAESDTGVYEMANQYAYMNDLPMFSFEIHMDNETHEGRSQEELRELYKAGKTVV